MAYIGEQRLKELLTLIKGKLDTVKVDVSETTGNAIEQKADGIYVDLSTYATKSDLNTLIGSDVDTTLDTIKELGDAIKDNKTLIEGMHSHTNKGIIDKFSQDNDGNLLFDGSSIKAGSSGDVSVYLTSNEYSKTEKVIGKYADGKPIYRKVIDCNFTLPKTNTGWTDTGVSVDNGYCPISCVGFMQGSPNSVNFREICISGGNILVKTINSDVDRTVVQLTLDYTKSTDVVNSFRPSMLTNGTLIASAPSYDRYDANEEVVVGRWINGKPIYRVMLQDTFPDATVDGTVVEKRIPYNTDSIDDVVHIYGTFYTPSTLVCQTINIVNNKSEYTTKAYIDKYLKTITLTNSQVTWNGSIATIIVEYTKTTDVKNSFRPEMIKTDALFDEVKNSDVADVLSVLGGN